MAISHLSRPTGESSKMVPVFGENCRFSCFDLHCHLRWFASQETSFRPQVGHTTTPSGPALPDDIADTVVGVAKILNRLLQCLWRFHEFKDRASLLICQVYYYPYVRGGCFVAQSLLDSGRWGWEGVRSVSARAGSAAVGKKKEGLPRTAGLCSLERTRLELDTG